MAVKFSKTVGVKCIPIILHTFPHFMQLWLNKYIKWFQKGNCFVFFPIKSILRFFLVDNRYAVIFHDISYLLDIQQKSVLRYTFIHYNFFH